jgi:hypothetical protein
MLALILGVGILVGAIGATAIFFMLRLHRRQAAIAVIARQMVEAVRDFDRADTHTQTRMRILEERLQMTEVTVADLAKLPQPPDRVGPGNVNRDLTPYLSAWERVLNGDDVV